MKGAIEIPNLPMAIMTTNTITSNFTLLAKKFARQGLVVFQG